MGLNKSIISALIIGGAIGIYMFYGQPFADQIGEYFGFGPSSYLYGTVGIVFVGLASLFAKMITRGLK